MRMSLVAEVLKVAVLKRRNVLLVGEPGVGKTDLITQVAKATKSELIVSTPAVSDPTDAKGLPFAKADGGEAYFLPYGDLAKAMKAKKRTIWFLDDLGQASPAVQASFMQLLLARKVGEHKLSDHVTFVAATNDRTHKAGVNGILAPVLSRFKSIIKVECHFDDWKIWAYGTDGEGSRIDHRVISFLNFRGMNVNDKDDQLFHRFDPKASALMQNYPMPRTWAAVSDWLNDGLPDGALQETIAGAVGTVAAGEFMTFLTMYRDLPNPDAVIVDPDKALIPKEPSVQYALATALAARCNEGNFGRITRYAQRMYKQGLGEIAALIVRDSVRACPRVQNTAEYAQFLFTDLGSLLKA